MPETLIIRHLGLQAYAQTLQAMQHYTATRNEHSADEIWILQHPPVYTLGQAGKAEHLLRQTQIPVVQVDRGGQITYHGPGQLIAYVLLDLRRHKIGVRDLVRKLENIVIQLLAAYNIHAYGKIDAPGVYVDEAKIASLGLRIRHGCCYHGLSVNVEMDLQPFQWINPCGYRGLQVTQMRHLGVEEPLSGIEVQLSGLLEDGIISADQIDYTHKRPAYWPQD